MTPNDSQIDVLLRRHAGRARSGHATEHLDADELNAFAEGSLPAAARSRYMSHLADCDDCRKVASQLAISSGAVVTAEAESTTADQQGYSWWKRISAFFSPLTLRYAALAVVLVTVLGGVVLITRRSRETNFVARNESVNQPQVSAVKPADSSPPSGLIQAEQNNADRSAAASTVAPSPMTNKQEAIKVAENPPPKPEEEKSKVDTPVVAAKKAAEPYSSPSYAPPPPLETERAGTVSREAQALPGNETSGLRKSESSADKYKVMDRSRAGELAKDSRAEDDNKRVGVNQAPASPASNRGGSDEKAAPRRDVDSLARARNAKEGRSQTTAAQSAGAETRDAAEAAPETRSAGGRKFRRQGNAWIDSKFKSSMTLKSISRGSSEFGALDSGLRSIAQQISGEVIVVWKGKAYLIR